MHRSPRQIALDIHDDYASRGKPIPEYAAAYVIPMSTLYSWDSSYFHDDAVSIARYAMSNLNGWRGEKAREIKAEVKGILKDITGY
jgi:hypothetical protein